MRNYSFNETTNNIFGSATNLNNQKKPNNYMVLAIIGTILGLFTPCCLGIVLGIIAIIYATQVNTKYNIRDFEGSLKSSKTAKILSIISVVIGGISLIIFTVNIVLYGFNYYIELINQYYSK